MRTSAAAARSSPRRGRVRSSAGAPVRNPGPAIQFELGIPYLEWAVGNNATIGMSHLSTEYVPVPVAATKAGASYNPTGDVVQFAFMPTATQVPGTYDWVSGAWDSVPSNILYPYNAKCLVGPNGVTNPGIGTYVIYLKITDNPEIPVLIAGQLQIT